MVITRLKIGTGTRSKELPRDKYYLSKKVGRYGKDGVNSWDYSAKRVTDSVYESMERLNVDYLDIINVHDIEFADLNQVVNETLPALVALKEKGIVKHVGITDLQLENLKWVVDHVPQVRWSRYRISAITVCVMINWPTSLIISNQRCRHRQCVATVDGTVERKGYPFVASRPKSLVEAL